MAVCNLFNELTSASGNFLMFSQYTEDITRNFSDGDNYKVVPSNFIALDIDYNNIDIPNTAEDLNISVPKYFQNCFENICAYDKANNAWNSNIFKNIFWNSMYKGKFVTPGTIEENSETYNYVNEIMCINNINMHSYNTHQGMGYSEIYCYIPTDKSRQRYKVNINSDGEYTHNLKHHLEGFYGDINYLIPEEYKNQYYTRDLEFDISTDESTVATLQDNKYNINTLVILYSVLKKVNSTWEPLYTDIPMGIYFAGKFEGTELTNTITKHVNTSYSTGTAYGLRICTRFSATSNGKLINADIVADDSNQTNLCQLMSAMSENLAKMMEVTKSAIADAQGYKDHLSIIINNKTNVPYIKTINGKDYWFVNGKMISNNPI